jgi:hypothetical protein
MAVLVVKSGASGDRNGARASPLRARPISAVGGGGLRAEEVRYALVWDREPGRLAAMPTRARCSAPGRG